jgi:TRAP-type C4-dicarboxylate transport system substrate-binding protein
MRIFAALCGAAFLLAGLGSGDARAQRTLKINESVGPGSVEDVALARFKTLVEEGSQNQLRIQIHLNDSLGNAQTSLENLTTGTLELYSGAMEYYQPVVPMEIGLMSIPSLLKDHAHMRRYLTSPAFEQARAKLLERGIRFISTEFNADRGPYRVFVSTKPVNALADLDGMRIRMFPNEIAIKAWRHLGTVPTVMPHTETYLALRQGVVQGAPYPIAIIWPVKFTEVAKYVFRTDEFPQTWPITVSERIWRSLPPAQQELLVRSANEVGKLYAAETVARIDKDIETMKREHGAVFAQVDLAPFRERMRGFHEQLVAEGVVTKPLYDAVVALGR